MAHPLIDYSPELELFESNEFELSAEAGVFGEIGEMELAAELLEVRDEQELDRFLGNLIRKVGRTVGTVVRSPVGRAIGGVLKDAAKTMLPLAGGALGSVGGGPVGATLGTSLASVAGHTLGLELEGLSPEDREFEAAKQFVRFGADAVKNAASARAGDPLAAARVAAIAAARRYAPGLLRGDATAPPLSSAGVAGGRWIRKGRNIVIVNC